MTSLPPAVQKTVDAANQAAAEAGVRNVPQASQGALKAGLTPEPKGDSPPAESPPVQPVQPVPAAAAPAGDPPIDWERRFRAMKGQYDAEVPRFKAEIEQLRTQVAQMQATSSPPESSASPAPKTSDRWYNDEQLEEFGQDFFDLVDRRVGMIEQSYGDRLDTLVKENAQLKQRLTELGQGVQKVQTQPLFTVLDNQLPQWKELNTDPAFLAWANETPVSDLDDRSMLIAMRMMFDQGRVDGVVKIFQMYLAQSQGSPAVAHQQPVPATPDGMPARQPPVPPVSPPAQPAARQPVDMGSLAGPGMSQESGADPLAQQGSSRTWTDASIAQFYDQVRRGQLQPQEVQALEADLQQAISPEGRRAGRYRPR